MWMQAAAWLVAINLATFGAFALDKRRAQAGGRRVPEMTLLKLAAAGGSPAAIAAQRLLRHKTRKEPFRSRLRLVALAQLALLALLVVLGAR